MNTLRLLSSVSVFFLFSSNGLRADSPQADWYRFFGSAKNDFAVVLAVDGNDDIYVGGNSAQTWGLPINEHAGGSDQFGNGFSNAFVAKVSDEGQLLWHTFLGSTLGDSLDDIAVDRRGDVYVAGTSSGPWGSPINSYSGATDAFVAKLNTDGKLLWNTFMGSAGSDSLQAIIVARGGGIIAVGTSYASGWGTPIDSHSGDADTFVVKLSNEGQRIWHTFMGSESSEYAATVAATKSGNIVVAGTAYASWGKPVSAFSGGGSDAFVASLDANGARVWNSFVGSSTRYLHGKSFYGESAAAVVVDDKGNIYVSGTSSDWGTPLKAHTGGNDANTFVAKLDRSGQLLWNTFTGTPGQNAFSRAAVANNSRHVFVLVQHQPHYSPGTPTTASLVEIDAEGRAIGDYTLYQNRYGLDVYDFDFAGSDDVYLAGLSLGEGVGTPRNHYAGDGDAVLLRYVVRPMRSKACYVIKSRTGRVFSFCLGDDL